MNWNIMGLLKKFWQALTGKQEKTKEEKKAPTVVEQPEENKTQVPVKQPIQAVPVEVEDKPREPIKVPEKQEKTEVIHLPTELVKESEKYLHVREKGGANKGPDVERFQRAVDGVAQGEPWCMAFMQYCLKEIESKYKVKSTVFRSEGCTTTYDKTVASLKSKKEGNVGDWIVWNYSGSWKGHVGIITKVNANGVS